MRFHIILAMALAIAPAACTTGSSAHPDQVELESRGHAAMVATAALGTEGGLVGIGVPSAAASAAAAAGVLVYVAGAYIAADVAEAAQVYQRKTWDEIKKGRVARRIARTIGSLYEAQAILHYAAQHGLSLSTVPISQLQPGMLTWQRGLSTGDYADNVVVRFNSRGADVHRSVPVQSGPGGYRIPDSTGIVQAPVSSARNWRGRNRSGPGGRHRGLAPVLTVVEAKCHSTRGRDWPLIALTMSQAYGFGVGLAAELKRRHDVASAQVVYLLCNSNPEWLEMFVRPAVRAGSGGIVSVQVHQHYGMGKVLPDHWRNGLLQAVLTVGGAMDVEEANVVFDVMHNW